MLFIDTNSHKIREAKHDFYKKMSKEILKRIEKIGKVEIEGNPINESLVKRLFELHIISQLEKILVGTPHELEFINSDLNVFIQEFPHFKKAIEYVFDYENWFVKKTKRRYSAYHLAQALDINTCVYCNLNYTKTITTRKGEKLSRPEFDHYFDKGKNPLLALSFFNLIPSCHTCNSSLKHSSTFTLKTHIHPYVENKIDEVVFSYKYDSKGSNGLKVKLSAPNCNRTDRTLKDFSTRDVYDSHTDVLMDMLKTRQAYSERYLEILSNNLLNGVVKSKNELYRLAFGTELDAPDFKKRPMSKFKYDLLKELGIIK